MKKRHLILGSSAASCGTMTKLRKLAPDDEIICLTAQADMPYNTCLLADYLSEGTPPTALWTKKEDFFSTNNITLHRNHRVIKLNPDKQTVICSNGGSFSYDTLFIGTGTRARALPVERPVTSGLFGFQTLSDTVGIDTFIQKQHPKTALVIGAGLSGIECADALVERGLMVTLAEYGTHLLPTLINKHASDAIATHLSNSTFISGCRTEQITVGPNGRATGALLNDGRHLTADIVVVAIGALPNSEFAAEASLALHQNGIVVDRSMQSSNKHIFAGGDVAAVPLRGSEEVMRNGTWPDAVQQGMYAAYAMAEQPKPYPGLTAVLSSHFFDTQFVSCGPITNPPATYTITQDQGPGWYHMLLTHDNTLKGFVLIDRLAHVGLLRRLVTTQEPLPANLYELLST